MPTRIPTRPSRHFWAGANKLDRMVLFFTDGHRQAILRLGIHVLPDGTTEYPANLFEKQPRNYFYLSDYAWPRYVDKVIGPGVEERSNGCALCPADHHLLGLRHRASQGSSQTQT